MEYDPKIGIPVAAELWYGFYTWRKLFPDPDLDPDPEPGAEPENPKTLKRGAIAKYTLWSVSIFSFVPISDVLENKFDFFNRWEHDPRFKSSAMIWLVGGLNSFSSMLGKDFAYTMGLLTSIVQAVYLAELHITGFASDLGYSLYLAYEEWMKLGGKILTNAAGLIKGSDEYASVLAALGATVVGSRLGIARVILEYKGKRNVLLTGMDVS